MLRSVLIGLVATISLLGLSRVAAAQPAEAPAIVAAPAAEEEGFFAPLTAPITALVDLLAEPFRPTRPDPLGPSILSVGRLSAEPLPLVPDGHPYLRSGWRNGLDFGLDAITWERAGATRRDFGVPLSSGTRRPWI